MAIPKIMNEKYDEIAPIIIKFCDEKLNEDYKQLTLKLLEKLCRKRPSPLLKGRAATWASGIIYVIGANNFIFDKSQEIHMSAAELAEWFELSASTTKNKALEIRNMIDISPLDYEWMLPHIIDENPAVWMVMVNGFIVDIRTMPQEAQQQAFDMGLIPYVPQKKD
ncbi:MAG: hypothetical protein K0S55_1821 [Clostridia bacterium]|nr:hypothetical protein [Clostridia bacterium]